MPSKLIRKKKANVANIGVARHCDGTCFSIGMHQGKYKKTQKMIINPQELFSLVEVETL